MKSRAMKIQPYFESGFPIGPDQWISQAGTAWAVMKTKGSAYLKRARKRMTTKRDIVQAFRILLDRAVDIGYKAGHVAGQKTARRRARARSTK